jgi:hypothetical protein
MGAKGGKKGGSAGGKTAAANMTAKERKARAKNAVAVREAKRKSKGRRLINRPFHFGWTASEASLVKSGGRV